VQDVSGLIAAVYHVGSVGFVGFVDPVGFLLRFG